LMQSFTVSPWIKLDYILMFKHWWRLDKIPSHW